MLFRMRRHFCRQPEAPAPVQVSFSKSTTTPTIWVRENGGGNSKGYMNGNGVCHENRDGGIRRN